MSLIEKLLLLDITQCDEKFQELVAKRLDEFVAVKNCKLAYLTLLDVMCCIDAASFDYVAIEEKKFTYSHLRVGGGAIENVFRNLNLSGIHSTDMHEDLDLSDVLDEGSAQ
jgi:hypothetical protein